MAETPRILPWKNKFDAYRQALVHISDRKNGRITSLKCRSEKLNDAGTSGFEFHTAWCFASRPAGGKSLLKEQLIREFYELNPHIKFRTLDFDLEMVPMMTALREFSAVIGRSYKYLLYAEDDGIGGKMSKEEFDRLKSHVAAKKAFRDDMGGYPIDVVEDAPTPSQFEATIDAYMEAHCIKGEDGSVVYPNVVVSIDHIRMCIKGDLSELEMLYEMGNIIVRLKKKYPILFLIFTHLNRSVTEAARCDNGKIANYITEADVHGSDSQLQSCDIVVGMDRPWKRKIEYYGPERFITNDPDLIIFHFLKVRNGDGRISFFRANFAHMKIEECDTPATGRDMSKVRN